MQLTSQLSLSGPNSRLLIAGRDYYLPGFNNDRVTHVPAHPVRSGGLARLRVLKVNPTRHENFARHFGTIRHPFLDLRLGIPC